MPMTEVNWADGWVAVPPIGAATRVSARGTGFYVCADAPPPDGQFDTALALPSNESLYVEGPFFVHASQPVVPASVYTTGAILQVTNGS